MLQTGSAWCSELGPPVMSSVVVKHSTKLLQPSARWAKSEIHAEIGDNVEAEVKQSLNYIVGVLPWWVYKVLDK